MSYKVQVKAIDDPKFYDNQIRLATLEEAQAYGEHKVRAWTLAEAFRVEESEDAVNYSWEQGRLVAV
jgi:hypothetical protein